jgi:hypothetical protein
VALLLLAGPLSGTAHAGARHFTYLYEVPTARPGSYEMETYATGRFADDRLAEAAIRHELEIGITNHLQLGIYVANWNYIREGEDQDARYNSSSLEVIHNLTNPVTDPIGISLYQEFSGGRRALESETKLLAQHNFGPLILAYNLTVEAGWEGEGLRERESEIVQAWGASYEIVPSLSAGIELLHEIVLPEWKSDEADYNFFVGPNLAFRGDGWFVTVTGLAQATNTDGEPDYQVRLIFGIDL